VESKELHLHGVGEKGRSLMGGKPSEMFKNGEKHEVSKKGDDTRAEKMKAVAFTSNMGGVTRGGRTGDILL